MGSDKVFENTSEDGATHVIERRCVINVDAPYLLRKVRFWSVIYYRRLVVFLSHEDPSVTQARLCTNCTLYTHYWHTPIER